MKKYGILLALVVVLGLGGYVLHTYDDSAENTTETELNTNTIVKNETQKDGNALKKETLDTRRSSWVQKAEYTPETKELLLVLNGKTYIYTQVPLETWANFKKAESFGSFYNKNIKNKFSTQ